MTSTRLDSFQLEVLGHFFRLEKRFFLTGGGALAGYYLGHRGTKDLDLFTPADLLDEGVSALEVTAQALGATVEALQTAPSFRRFLLRRGTQSVVVDLVHDFAPQLFAEKRLIGEIRVDPPEEILANKLCALLSRSELKDLVDVRALEGAGYSMESGLHGAAQKDGGLTPGQLAWVLSQVTIGDDAQIPGGGSTRELRAYLSDLVARLTRWALPDRPTAGG